MKALYDGCQIALIAGELGIFGLIVGFYSQLPILAWVIIAIFWSIPFVILRAYAKRRLNRLKQIAKENDRR